MQQAAGGIYKCMQQMLSKIWQLLLLLLACNRSRLGSVLPTIPPNSSGGVADSTAGFPVSLPL
jgi:hypothetical protein